MEGRSQKRANIITLCVFAAIVIALVLIFVVFRERYTVNTFDSGSVHTIDDGLKVARDKARDLAFEYPEGCTVTFEDSGDYVRTEAGVEAYIYISRVAGETTPKKYFKKYAEMLKADYGTETGGEITETICGGKTLYSMTATLESGRAVTRYAELYKDFVIEYTVCGFTGGEETPLMETVATTLMPYLNSYEASFSTETTPVTNVAGGYTVNVPAIIEPETRDGFITGSSGPLTVTAAFFNTDYLNNAVDSSDDFIKYIEKTDNYLGHLIGGTVTLGSLDASSATDGRKSYTYTISVKTDEETLSGSFTAVSISGRKGCYFVCYTLADGCDDYLEYKSLGEAFLSSLDIGEK